MLRVRTVWALPVVELLQIWNMITLYSYSSHFALPFIIFSRLVPSNSFGSCYCSPWSPVLHLSQYRYGRIRFGGSLWVIHYQKWFLRQHGQYWWPSLCNWWVLRPVAVRIPVPNSSYRQQYVHSYIVYVWIDKILTIGSMVDLWLFLYSGNSTCRYYLIHLLPGLLGVPDSDFGTDL